MKRKLKIIVAHPGKQHSYQLAAAIKKYGCLYRYITTYYAYSSEKKSNQSFFFLKSIAERAAGRNCNELDDEDVKTYGKFIFYIVAFLLRVDKKGNLYRMVNGWLANIFGSFVAKYAIANMVDIVIMYDTNSERCFSILEKKAPHIIRIQDVSAINRLYMKNIYEEDMKQSPQFAKKLMVERGFLFQKKYQEYWKKEIEKSDYFIVPSDIVAESLVFSGVKKNHIFKCPYGTYFETQDKKHFDNNVKKLEILYIGNVTQMKGVFYLLEAIEQLPANQFHLTVVGKYDENSNLIKQYKERVSFTGYIMHEETKRYLQKADIFVFPSLGDSFGLSVLEAMSFAIPVICSDHAGAADAIVNGENGFVVPAGSVDDIKQKLVYFYEHPEFVQKAGEKACKTTEIYTWNHYKECVGDMLAYLMQRNYLGK